MKATEKQLTWQESSKMKESERAYTIAPRASAASEPGGLPLKISIKVREVTSDPPPL